MVWKARRRRLLRRRLHQLGQFENVFGVLHRMRARRRIEPRQHRIDVMLVHDACGGGGLRLADGWRRRRRCDRPGRIRHARRRRSRTRRRSGGHRCGRRLRRRLGSIVVSNDSADGGENLLHRWLLRLRRLAHSISPSTPSRQRRAAVPGIPTCGGESVPQAPIVTRIAPSMTRDVRSQTNTMWILELDIELDVARRCTRSTIDGRTTRSGAR